MCPLYSRYRSRRRIERLAAIPVHGVVRQARRLREAVLSDRRADEPQGILERDQVSRGHEYRLHVPLRPERGSHGLVGLQVDERRPLPGFVPRLFVVAREDALRAADRRNAKDQTEMRCDAKPARVRDADAVDHEYLWLLLELLPGLEEHGYLAEGEEAGYVRERDRILYGRMINLFEVGIREGHESGEPFFREAVHRDVAPTNICGISGKRHETDLFAQFLLQRDGFLRRERPVHRMHRTEIKEKGPPHPCEALGGGNREG